MHRRSFGTVVKIFRRPWGPSFPNATHGYSVKSFYVLMCILGVQVRNMKMVFNISTLGVESGRAMNTNDKNL